MARNATAAIEWGRAWVDSAKRAPTRSGDWYQWCLVFVRMCFGVNSRYPSAIAAWENAERRHNVDRGSQVPAGVPVFWRTGKWGHVALSVGNGYCLSNDILRKGEIDVVHIDVITKRWNATLLGWTEDLNGVTVVETAKPKPPAVRVYPTFRRLLDRELSLIEALGKVKRGTPEHARLERQLALVYKYAATYPASQYAALRREYHATRDLLYRTQPGKKLAREREARKITRLDLLVRRGLPS